MNWAKGIIRMAVLIIFCLGSLAANPVAYYPQTVNRIPVKVVVLDLNSKRVSIKPALASDLNGKAYPAQDFKKFIYRYYPVAAVNGTFCDTRTYNLAATVIIDGKIRNYLPHGTAVCFLKSNQVSFIPMKYLPASLPKEMDVISSGPTLIFRGKINLCPRAEGFNDPALFSRARRTALGLTQSNKLLLLTVAKPVYLRELAQIMLKLGCSEAVALDGGSSSALYYRGNLLTRPNRLLTNVLLVYEKPAEIIYLSTK